MTWFSPFSTHFTSFLLGVLVHLGLFIREEWHLRAPAILLVHLSSIGCGTFLYSILWGLNSTLSGLLLTLSLFCSYSLGLFGSIGIYRMFFHRLRHFPGPRLAALTKLWHVYQCRDSRNHLLLDSLYKKYGSFVRTGPEEITIFHPGAFEALDGAHNQNSRSDWYDIVHPRISPIFAREDRDQQQRRKVWNQALSTRSISGYIPRILTQIDSLEHAIDKFGNQPVPINDVMQWFAFDSMGEFAFNQGFDMLKTAKWHEAVIHQRSALAILGSFNPAIWTVRLAFSLFPSFWRIKDWFSMVKFCDLCMSKRLETDVHEPDIASWFIKEYESGIHHEDPVLRQNLLSGNALSVVVGGSDTTGPSLIILWYFLALHPEHAQKIRGELHTVDIDNMHSLAALPHLNGFINESMRLLPAALTMGTRVTPPGGLVLDKTFIPGNVKIAAPRYTIFRLEDAFEDSLSFIPERWYSRPEMVKNKRAFAPFATGRRTCVGQSLALTQIRLLTARLLKNYRVSFPQGTNGDAVERDMRDQVTAQAGRFFLLFKRIQSDE